MTRRADVCTRTWLAAAALLLRAGCAAKAPLYGCVPAMINDRPGLVCAPIAERR